MNFGNFCFGKISRKPRRHLELPISVHSCELVVGFIGPPTMNIHAKTLFTVLVNTSVRIFPEVEVNGTGYLPSCEYQTS